MINVALEASDLNPKKPDKRSFLDEVARNKVAPHMLEETKVETSLTLACGYAKAGDWQGVEKVMSESGSQGLGFDDGDYLEPMFVMSVGGHKEHIAKLLALTHPETEAFSSMASHLVVRLVNSGHDDVAYNLVQYTVDQSTEEGGRRVSEEFLQQIVRCVNNLNCQSVCWHFKNDLLLLFRL